MEMAGSWTVLIVALAGAVLVALAAYAAIRRSTGGGAELEAAREARLEAEGRAARLEETVRLLKEREGKADAEIADLKARVDAERERANRLERDLATLKVERENDAERAEQQIKELTEARAAMTKEFRLLAEEVMTKHGQAFKQQNREQLDGLLTPLRQQITEFHNNMTEARRQAAAGEATLKEQIRLLSDDGAKMRQEAANLTRALKGETQVRGAWGEMILSTILEKSGLRPGEEFVTQESETLADGSRLRPDAIVNLPGGRRIIIDSKVSLTAYEKYVNAADEAERLAHLRQHVAAVKTHVRQLSEKDYTQISGITPDYVILFVPIEGAFAAALEGDPELTVEALNRNITLASPTSLITLLRTVANLWQVDRQQKNAEDIADRAGKLYDKFEGFVGDMSKIRRGLDAATQAHDQAMGKLATGRGNLVNQAEMLRQLGAKTKKRLPEELIEDAVSPELLDGD